MVLCLPPPLLPSHREMRPPHRLSHRWVDIELTGEKAGLGKQQAHLRLSALIRCVPTGARYQWSKGLHS